MNTTVRGQVRRGSAAQPHWALLSLSAVLILAVFIATGCAPCSAWGFGNRHVAGSGIVARANLPLDDFRRVELQFDGDLVVNMGDEAWLIIEADDNLLGYLDAHVLDRTLIIRKMPSNVTLDAKIPIRYYLTATGLESLTTTSGGSIKVPALEADRLSITTKSSGSVYVDRVRAAQLEVTAQAAGGVTIVGGAVEEQSVTLTSSGGYHARNLASSRARVRLSSSGDAILAVRDRLDADLSSSGNLYYLGSPSINRQDSSSEARIVRLRE
jgi:hypothetical protein